MADECKPTVQINIDTTYLVKALEMAIASAKRMLSGKHVNPLMKQLVDSDIKHYEDAKASITLVPDAKQTKRA